MINFFGLGSYNPSPTKAVFMTSPSGDVGIHPGIIPVEKKHKVMNGRLIILWLIFCLGGNISQVYHISRLYFQYGINTNVQLVVRDEMTIPSTTLCFDITQVTKWKEMTKEERFDLLTYTDMFSLRNKTSRVYPVTPKYDVRNETPAMVKKLPSVLKSLNDYGSRVYLTGNMQKLNMKRLFNITYNLKELVENVFQYVKYYDLGIPGPNNTRISLWKVNNGYFSFSPDHHLFNDVFNVTTFFKDMHKCFTFELLDAYKDVKYYDVRRQTISPGMLTILQLRENETRHAGIMQYIVTPNGMKLRSGFFSFLPIGLRQRHAFAVTYETYETQLLRDPFESGCQEYHEFGYDSRGSCYESCVKENGLNMTNGLTPPGVNIYDRLDFNATLITNVDIMMNKSLNGIGTMNLIERLHDFCNQKCPAIDCHSVIQIPRSLANYGPVDNSQVIVMAPTTPTIFASSQPRLTLTQYLIDVFSTFGFWLGISAFGVFEFLQRSRKAVAEAYIISSERTETHKERRRRLFGHSSAKL
jgi:hypothetical protein